MMFVLQLKSTKLLLLFISSGIAFGLAEDETSVNIKLPSIWADEQNGGGNSEEASYRIRAEIQLSGSGKSFIIEEWASGLLEKFRLDMIETVNGRRRTYLTYKITDESFYYEPFQCKLIEDNFGSVLPKELADMVQPAEMSSEFVPIGVGALWIHALRLESSHKPASQENSGSCHLDGGEAAQVLDCFESFTVDATSNFAYDLIFYFKTNKLGPESLASIVIRQPNKSGPLMRIKILEFESSILSTLEELPDLFDLPPGYGCKRSNKIEKALDSPANIIGSDLLDPKAFRLNIVALLPATDDAEDHDQWRSHSASVRMVAGRLTLGLERQRDYLILERRELVPDKRLSGRRATPKSGRQVWDLGTAGGLEVATSGRKRRLFYELDDQLGKCLAFGESLELEEVAAAAGASINFFPSGGNPFEGQGQARGPPRGFTLDMQFLNTMFGAPTSPMVDGYHQIRKGVSASKLNLEELTFEKRLEKFEMRNQHGHLIWSGPVSLVRRDIQSRKLAWLAADANTLPGTSVTVHFLNPEANRVVGKVSLALNERRTISQATFHRELNVEPCFSQGQTLASGRHLEFSINYPLVSDLVADRLANCGHCQTMVEEQFLRALNNVSNNQLDPLQVDRINLEVAGSDMLKLSARLMVRPNLLNYIRQPGEIRFLSAHRSLLFSELQPNDSGCAESCAHYNCSAFAYCSENQQCDIFMGKPEILLKIGTEPAASCTLFYGSDTSDSSQWQRPPEPIEMVHLMREAIVKSEIGGKNPLGLWLTTCEHGNSTELAQLLPISLETSKDAAEDGGNGLDLLRSEYELVLENRRLRMREDGEQPPSSMFPLPEVKYMAYEDCRALCDQMDCKSFSHCQLDRTCQVSLLHDTEMLREHSERDDYCFVFARDSLSKFNQPPVPLRMAHPSATSNFRKLNQSYRHLKPLRVGETRDCASSCVNEIGFKCRSFYNCPQEQEQDSSVSSKATNCYLSKHYPRAGEILAAQASLDSDNLNQTILCQLYTRSHLADFDRFYGRALPAAEVDEVDAYQLVKRSLNAEACGLECALENCQAFHVCRQPQPIQGGSDTAKRSLEPVCVLMSKRANNDSDWLRPDKLEPNELCTSFIVAKESELRRTLSNSEPPGADSDDCQDNNRAPEGGAPATTRKTIVGKRWWLLDVLMLLVGLAIGHGVSLVWRRRHYSS